MKVLFITGLGRSGTNLLDLLLDSHSQVCSLGGVRRLPRAYRSKRRNCACGAPNLQTCPFWSRINAAMEERTGRDISSLRLEARHTETFQEENRILFQGLSDTSETPYIIDSSKSSRRLRLLLDMPDVEVIPIHLLRDPRGYAYSQSKRKRTAVVPAFSYTYRSLLLYQTLHKTDHIVIRYEHLAQNPEQVLHKLMDLLHLKFEENMLRWAEKTHHGLGAKDVLDKTHGSELRPDTAWRDRLPAYKQIVINGISWPARVANRVKETRWGLDQLHRVRR